MAARRVFSLLRFNRKGVLFAAGWVVLAMSLVCGAACAAQEQAKPGDAATGGPRFEVASVKLMRDRDKLPPDQQLFSITPSGAPQFRARNISLPLLMTYAFGVDSARISGKLDWLEGTLYEIAAKPEGDARLSYEQLRPLLQQLLQERFHLKYHRETKNVKGYALVVGKGGPKLQPSKGEAYRAYIMPDRLDIVNGSASLLAGMLATVVGVPAVDKTGLKGKYDLQLEFSRLEEIDSPKPSIFTAVQEQLGLKLVPQMVPVEMIVIDSADRVPTEN